MLQNRSNSLRLSLLVLAILAGLAMQKADARYHAECQACTPDAVDAQPS
jgi:hypothetical protein